MNITLILSAILLQIPLALYKDTLRRFQRMELYNPDKAIDYTFDNGSFADITWQVILFLLFGYILSFVPLVNGLEMHWLLCFVIHLVLVFLITPIIIFAFYPTRRIFTKRSLNMIGVISLILGILLFAIGIEENNI